jgi:NAD+ synthase (glutamine-hydrolysing)
VAGAELLVVISASPFRRGILERRLRHARRASLPLVYVNLCGATDELIFDGRSFVLDADGGVLARLVGFAEEVAVVNLAAAPQSRPEAPGGEEELHRALVLGIRDFAAKNRLGRAVLGLSGGVDSAVAAALAADALGPERVTAVTIPSRFTDPRSTDCARELAAQLGISLEEVALEPLHGVAEACLGELLGSGTAAENVQARLRMIVLMAFVNRHGGFLLNTTNKTEASLGYGTLYGDLAGSLCPLADLAKPEVVDLARWLHATRGLIPRFVLERPPSAELAAGQVDPFDYPTVAPAVESLVRADRSDDVLRRSEHKRWQMGVVLKVSDRAFGTGRLIPITRR